MAFRRAVEKMVRLFSWFRSPVAKAVALGVLAAVVLLRLTLTTYWSWGSPERVRLLIIWGLGLIALLMLARFTWHTLSPKPNQRIGNDAGNGNAQTDNRE